jgi:putative flippase GtrA
VWVSHYALGFTSLIADNIANNVIGLALGMIFRFALYRWWVFAPRRRELHRTPLEAPAGTSAAPR